MFLRCNLPCFNITQLVLGLLLSLQKVKLPAVPLLVCFPGQGVIH